MATAILNNRMQSAEYARNSWHVTPATGDKPDDLLDPKYWVHVCKSLKACDRIEDVLVPSEFVRIDEIGEIDRGGETVEGHHVNMVAYGSLAKALTAGGGWSGIFPLLGKMDAVEPQDGVPAGWEGASGVRIYPASGVNNRVRVWA